MVNIHASHSNPFVSLAKKANDHHRRANQPIVEGASGETELRQDITPALLHRSAIE